MYDHIAGEVGCQDSNMNCTVTMLPILAASLLLVLFVLLFLVLFLIFALLLRCPNGQLHSSCSKESLSFLQLQNTARSSCNDLHANDHSQGGCVALPRQGMPRTDKHEQNIGQRERRKY